MACTFQVLLYNEWNQTTTDGTTQWERTQAAGFNLWDSDVGIAYDIEQYWDSTTGEYQCIVNKEYENNCCPECPLLSETEDIVAEYADDNEAFLRQFQVTWTRLVTVGYDDGELFSISETTNSTEDNTSDDENLHRRQLMAAVFVMFANWIVS